MLDVTGGEVVVVNLQNIKKEKKMSVEVAIFYITYKCAN